MIHISNNIFDHCQIYWSPKKKKNLTRKVLWNAFYVRSIEHSMSTGPKIT